MLLINKKKNEEILYTTLVSSGTPCVPSTKMWKPVGKANISLVEMYSIVFQLLLLKVTFKGQDKWITPVHSLLTHFPEELTEDPDAWPMHSLRSCAVYQSSGIISRHLWVSHLVYWMKIPLDLTHTLRFCFSWLYRRKNRCRRRQDAQNRTLKPIYNPTPQSLVSQASLGHATHSQFLHWLKGWRGLIFPTH